MKNMRKQKCKKSHLYHHYILSRVIQLKVNSLVALIRVKTSHL